MKLKRPEKKLGDENVIPLINIVFLMLIFFLIAGTLKSFSNKDIKPVSLVEQSKSKSPKKIQLYLSASGDLFVNDHSIPKEQLTEYITTNLPEIQKQDKFNILVDQELDALLLVEIIELITNAGVTNSHIIAIRKSGS